MSLGCVILFEVVPCFLSLLFQCFPLFLFQKLEGWGGWMASLAQQNLLGVLSGSVVSNSATPWITAHQASLSFIISQSLLKLVSIESVKPSNRLILCCPFSSWPQTFTASGSFSMSWLFTSGGQSTGASVWDFHQGISLAIPLPLESWVDEPSVLPAPHHLLLFILLGHNL